MDLRLVGLGLLTLVATCASCSESKKPPESAAKPPPAGMPKAAPTPADPLRAEKLRLKELHEALAGDKGIYEDSDAGASRAQRFQELRAEFKELLDRASGGDPALRLALEDEAAGRAVTEVERDEWRRKLAEHWRKNLQFTRRAEMDPSLMEDPKFLEESAERAAEELVIMKKLLRSWSANDCFEVRQESVRLFAPDVYEEYSENFATQGMYLLVSAEEDFKSVNMDSRRDYWVGDVFGLQFLTRRNMDSTEESDLCPASCIGIIAIALADEAPLRTRRTSEPPPERPAPYWGYRYGRLVSCVVRGKSVAYDDGSHRNPDRFGFYAVPEKYKEFSRMSFIVNEKGGCWKKDTAGVAPTEFPERPETDGWIVVRFMR